MSKKVIAVLVCVVLVFAFFVGCREKASRDQASTTKEVATDKDTEETTAMSGSVLWSSHRTDQATTLFPTYVEEFNKIYPDVKVEIESFKDFKETIRIKMSAGDVPDIFSFGASDYTKDQIQANAQPLDDLAIASDFIGVDQFKGNDGKIYGLPTGMGATGVVYNKKIFAELGLTVPTTQDEFIDVAKKITASGKTGLASAAKAKWPLQYFFGAIPRTISGDADVINKCALVDAPFTADNAVVKGWALLKKWTDEKILEKDPLSADWEPMKKEFRAGNVGMFLLGNWFAPQAVGEALTIEDIGFFPFPYDNEAGSKRVSAGPDVSLAMSKNHNYPEAAEAFYLFLMDTKYADYAKECGLLSARKSVKVDISFIAEFDSYNPKYLYDSGDSAELNDVKSKAQFDADAFAQDIIAGKDFDQALSELNKKWTRARSK